MPIDAVEESTDVAPQTTGEPRSRTPLGFGDLKFKLSAAGAAISNLHIISELPLILIEESDAELVGKDDTALRHLEQFLLGNLKEHDLPGTLSVAGGVALVKCETVVARCRLSRQAMLARTKIYILRSAAYLAHCGASQRFGKTINQDMSEECADAILMADRYMRKAEQLHQHASGLRWHDWAWRLVGADLGVNLGQFDVLSRYGLKDIPTILNKLSGMISAARKRASADVRIISNTPPATY